MWLRLLIGGLALAALPGPASAQADERLVSPALPGFVLGHSAGNSQQSIREEVPAGETVQAWTRMVTTQRFVGLAARATVAAYARNILASLPRSCPGATASPITGLTVSGRPAARIQVDCPRSAGGQPETFILLAVAGTSDMHVKQIALRGGTTPAGLAWGRSFLSGTTFCAASSRARACR
jgi:hypothetical protein